VRFTKGENGKKDRPEKKNHAEGKPKKEQISVEKKFQITNKIP